MGIMAPYGETNGRERGREMAGGTCDISAISEITGFEETRKRAIAIVGLAIYGALGC